MVRLISITKPSVAPSMLTFSMGGLVFGSKIRLLAIFNALNSVYYRERFRVCYVY